MSKLMIVLSTIIPLSIYLVSNASAMGNQDSKPAVTTVDDFAEGKAAAYSGRYVEAIRLLKKVVDVEPKNADAYNYLGYSYRKIGKLELAESSYQYVFAINPNHKGALEYQGEMFYLEQFSLEWPMDISERELFNILHRKEILMQFLIYLTMLLIDISQK